MENVSDGRSAVPHTHEQLWDRLSKPHILRSLYITSERYVYIIIVKRQANGALRVMVTGRFNRYNLDFSAQLSILLNIFIP